MDQSQPSTWGTEDGLAKIQTLSSCMRGGGRVPREVLHGSQ